MAGNKSLETTAGNAVAAVQGWRKSSRRGDFPVYGKCREYVRADATPDQLARGYRLVQASSLEPVS